MCGIVGWIGHGEEFRDVGERALDRLTHRGPDSGALWISSERALALGSRRLAILDLGHRADQPMTRGDATLAHNGEIYNYVELREELVRSGTTFDTTSDTEVILAAMSQWGDAAIERFNGMFAFAHWDGRASTLTLARDRFGEKPLFYAPGQSCLHFASEIKALLAFPCVRRSPDPSTLYRYLASGAVPDGSRNTFFDGIAQVPPATLIRVRADRRVEHERRYWRLVADETARTLSFDDASDRLRELFADSVRIRLRSDVPVGTSLSGGIDSSLVALTAARLNDPNAPTPRTFSARHRASPIDEGAFITPVVDATRAIAGDVWVDPASLPVDADRLVWHQDEPFPHTSMLAQWKVYELARSSGVTVLLDGQGADEVFGGYHSLAFGAVWSGLLRRGDLRGLAAEIADFRRLHQGGAVLVGRYIAARSTPSWLRDRALRMRWRAGGLVKRLAPTARERSEERCEGIEGPLHRSLCEAVVRTSLPGLLRFADRSAMAHSIEVRLPFLDPRVVEFAFGLSEAHLVSRGWTKRILRRLLESDLPQIARRRDKIGFATPEAEWFRGPLRTWMAGLLTAAGRREMFERREIERMWESVLSGRTPSQVAWRVANVELWLRRYVDAAEVVAPEGVPAAR